MLHMNLSNSNLPSKIVSGFHLINHDKMKASKGGRSVHTHNTLETYFNHPANSLIIITSTGFHSLLAHVRMSGVIGYNSYPKSWEPLQGSSGECEVFHTTWDLKTLDTDDVQLDELTKYVIHYHQHSSIKAFFCYCLCVQGFALICLGLSIDLILL